jgi:hypothetical protein
VRWACALCRTPGRPEDVALDLGLQPSMRHYPLPTDPVPDPTYPLALWVCPSCGLAQLQGDETNEPEVPVVELAAAIDQERRAVDDIADLLVGRTTAHAFDSPHGGSGIAPYSAQGLMAVDGPADVVVDTFGIMHDVDQAAAFAARAAATSPDGILVFTIQPADDIVASGQWSSLRHGHVAYYSITAMRNALARVGFVPIRLLRYDLYGGTAVVVAQRGGQPDAALREAYESEAAAGLTTPAGFAGLRESVAASLESLRRYLDGHAARGTRLYAYGAPSRAIALLAGVGDAVQALTATADASPAKQRRCLPVSRIAVISPEELIAAQPDEVLLLLSDLRDEVLAAYPALTGRLVTDLPDPDGGRRTDADG